MFLDHLMINNHNTRCLERILVTKVLHFQMLEIQALLFFKDSLAHLNAPMAQWISSLGHLIRIR